MNIGENLINNAQKRTQTGEIIVTLFELCDLNCLFCNQDHNSIFGIDLIEDKIISIEKAIKELEKKGKKNFSINIMGGEIFSDKLPDEIFSRYTNLVTEIKNLNYDIEISFVTNFVWQKTERVRKFINDNNIILMSSYDPSGRFNNSTFDIFKKNVVEFTKNTKSMNVIMTKPNIDKFLKNNIPFFDYLYENFDIYFDYYTPEKNIDFFTPKDYDLKEFFIYVLENWPNSNPFKNFKYKIKNNMSCMDTYTIMPDGTFGSCQILVTGVNKIVPIKNKMEEEWLNTYNCLECEHFSRCSLGCFLSNHLKNMKTQEVCWLKQVYDFVDTGVKNECTIN